MERSFRAMGTVMKDREEDLALFIEMRRREKERNSLLLTSSEEPYQPLDSQSPTLKILRSTVRKAGVDDLLNLDSEKNDYDWLLTPPGTPLFPYLEESYRPSVGHHGTPNGHTSLLKSRMANPADSSSRNVATSRQLAPSASLNSSSSGMRRPSSSGGSSVSSSRPATPTGRITTHSASKLPRSSTPASRSMLPPPKPAVAQPRSSTPIRSSTPTSRSSVPPASKLASRSNTPTRRPSTPSGLQATVPPPSHSSLVPKSVSSASSNTRSIPAVSSVTRSGPRTSSIARSGPTNSIQRSIPPTNSVPKSGPTGSKIAAPSRGTSPTIRSRPWKPSEMPGYSHDAPPNLKTTLPDRSSPSRGRPGAPSGTRSSSVDNVPNVRPRRQSCSPSRGTAPKGNVLSGSSVPASNRSGANRGYNDSPVVIGTKMVERVVNSRRLAPLKHDNLLSRNPSSVKSSLSPDSIGFGRTLSKKSLDMAMRHMDIRRSIPNTLRPLMNNIPASSLYSVRSGFMRGRAVSVSGSPLATSSNASSEQSASNSAFCFDGNEIEHDHYSEKGGRMPSSFSAAR